MSLVPRSWSLGFFSVSLDRFERHFKTWTKLPSFPNQGYERFHLDDRLRLLSLHKRFLVIACSSVACELAVQKHLQKSKRDCLRESCPDHGFRRFSAPCAVLRTLRDSGSTRSADILHSTFIRTTALANCSSWHSNTVSLPSLGVRHVPPPNVHHPPSQKKGTLLEPH